MWRRCSILAPACLITAFCGGFQENPTHHYHLQIDPSFSSDQTQAILDAATEWQQSSNSYVTFDGASAFTDVITFKPVSAQELTAEFGGGYIGVTGYDGQSAEIQLITTLDPLTFHQTALHEIGHAIGLVHTTPGNIMCANTMCATLEVTCGDLNQLTHQNIPGCWP